MNFDKVIRERFSVRSFKDTLVSDEILNKILEAGVLAPTAKNLQPEKIYVIKSSEGLSSIDKASPCRYNAPVCLIIASDKDIAWKKGTDSTYEMDATIVGVHMMLEATNLGVDSVWVKMFDKEILKREFEIPSNIEPVCLLPLGYRSDDSKPSDMHYMRKNLKDIVIYK